MKEKSVKYNLNRLVRKAGGKKEVAKLLGVTVRYIDMMLAGRTPGESLRKLIRLYARGF